MTGRWQALTAQRRDETGNAVVEFLCVTLILLVPTVYLILVLSAVQRATFAVEGAAREAGRVLTAGPGQPGVADDAVASVALALADQGLTEIDPTTALQVVCDAGCGPGTTAVVTVRADVTMPGVPAFVESVVPLSVPVSSTYVVTVDPFAGLS